MTPVPPEPDPARHPAHVVCAGPVPRIVETRLRPYAPLVSVPATDEDALAAAGRGAVAILARAATPVTARVIAAAPGLRVIGRSGVGVDNVDLDAATRRCIPVVVTPYAGVDAVAEGALSLLLALGRRLPALTAAVRDGHWSERDSADMLDIRDSRVGIVGLGRIGTRLAQLVLSLGGHVLGHDPFVTQPPPGISLAGLDELFARSHFISLHVPLTEGTRGLVDARLLSSCQPGTILVNAARGGLISSLDDLWHALDSGNLGGVGLDVFDHEPPDVSHPLFHDPRVILTPHALALSRRGRERIFEDMCAGVEAALQGQHAPHIANPAIYG